MPLEVGCIGGLQEGNRERKGPTIKSRQRPSFRRKDDGDSLTQIGGLNQF